MSFGNHINPSMLLASITKHEAPSRYRVGSISRLFVWLCIVLVALLTGTAGAAGLPSFPGAEGAGALAVGGRGGVVCKVTNLNDSGSGSLRGCVERSGPRTVIFEVGGTIKLRGPISIRDPYITVAGQTAPGGGIQIKADKANWAGGANDLLIIRADHVIVRHLRFRKGYTGNKAGNIRVRDPSRNVIVDHVSLFWGENQNWTVYSNSDSSGPQDITLQNSIIAEMLDNRVNVLLGAGGSGAALMENIDHHNNLIATARHRNPLGRYASGRWVNNIIYNWRSWASRGVGGVHQDWVSNIWKAGPAISSDEKAQYGLMFVRWSERHNRPHAVINRAPSLYIEGNRDLVSGMTPDTDNWPYTREAGPTDNGDIIGATPMEWRRDEPLPVAGRPITVRHVDQLESHLLPILGASRRLDCEGNWVENRDEADARVVDEYLTKRGTRAESGQGEEIYGGHPSIAAGVPCVDTSGDGLPDAWVTANGLDPTDPSLGATVHDSGYTYLELYINGMRLTLAPPSRIQQITVD